MKSKQRKVSRATVYRTLDALETDHQFLVRDEVFPESLIRRWLEIKHDEINAINRRPHPFEFSMYFDF